MERTTTDETTDEEKLDELRQFRETAREAGNDEIGAYGDPQTDDTRHGTTEYTENGRTWEVLTAESRAFVVQTDGVHDAKEWASPDEDGILRDSDGLMYGVDGWHVERVETPEYDKDADYQYNLELHEKITRVVEEAIEHTQRRDDESPSTYRERVAVSARVFLTGDLTSMEIFGYGTDLLDAAIKNIILNGTDPWVVENDERGRESWRNGGKRITLFEVDGEWRLEYKEWAEHLGEAVVKDFDSGGPDDYDELRYRAEEWMVNNRE